MKIGRRSGFTLLEVAAVSGLLVIVMSALVLSQGSVTKLLSTTSTSGLVVDEARQVLDVMSTELRWAQGTGLLITAENGASRIDFQTGIGFAGGVTQWSTPITYHVRPSPIDANNNGIADDWRLVRTQNGTNRTLCDFVAAGGLTATRNNNAITLQLRLSRTDPATRRPLRANERTTLTIRN